MLILCVVDFICDSFCLSLFNVFIVFFIFLEFVLFFFIDLIFSSYAEISARFVLIFFGFIVVFNVFGFFVLFSNVVI